MWCKRIVSETRETSIQGLVLEGEETRNRGQRGLGSEYTVELGKKPSL